MSGRPLVPVDGRTTDWSRKVANAINSLNVPNIIQATGNSVLDYGATGNGSTDDTAAIQAAVNAVVGGTVRFPRGRYRVTSPITVARGIRFLGEGWEPYVGRTDEGTSGVVNPAGAGSYFYCNTPGIDLFNITAKSGVTFEDIAFDWSQPDPSATASTAWTPTTYGWAIKSSTVEVLQIKNVFMRNPFKGVRLDTSTEKLFVDGLWAQPLGALLDLDFMSDVAHISDLHCWQFYSINSNVMDYCRANAVGILSGRNDNPFFSNIFTIGLRAGIEFKNSETASGNLRTNKFHLQNADLDLGKYGISILPSVVGVTGQISNFTAQGASTITDSRAINIEGTNSRIQVVNFRSTNTHRHAVRLSATGNKMWMENTEFEAWGLDTTSPAIAVDNGNAIFLGENVNWNPSGVTTKFAIGSTASIVVGGAAPIRLNRASATQTVTTGVSTKVGFTTADFDVDGIYDSTNDRILPQIPGYYRVSAAINFQATTDGALMELAVARSGTKVSRNLVRASGTSAQTVSVHALVKMNGTTDYLELFCQQNSGSDQAIDGTSALTFFELARL